jgi:hypothetical protein
MAPTGRQLVFVALTQRGDIYKFGGKAGANIANPHGLDCCLAGGTAIPTRRGLVRIDELVSGDIVSSWEEGELVENKVAHLLDRGDQMLYRLSLSDRQIDATANHPFLRVSPEGHTQWVRLQELGPGDEIVTVDNPNLDEGWGLMRGEFATQTIESISPLFMAPTYDIELEGEPNFVAEGIVVHNSGLTAWAAARLGVTLPGGASNQHALCVKKGHKISQAQAKVTPGALGFASGSSHGPSGWHVVISQGTGNATIEARSTKYGINVFPIEGRNFNQGWYLCPGFDYLTPAAKPPPAPPAPTPVPAGPNPLKAVADALQIWRHVDLHVGDRNDGVKFLRAGLRKAGYWCADGDFFDEEVMFFVAHFQEHWGLSDHTKPDWGVCDRAVWFTLTILAGWPNMT